MWEVGAFFLHIAFMMASYMMESEDERNWC